MKGLFHFEFVNTQYFNLLKKIKNLDLWYLNLKLCRMVLVGIFILLTEEPTLSWKTKEIHE